jgi:DNA-binding CsgD family transcriptional regulator
MAMDATIDARMQAALARLTDNEKECLRRRLRQQTAKEMALDLGVSPHAVEKRLKMARTKLGLSSSLEAARLLAATEGYQQMGPQAVDLARPPSARQVGRHHQLIWGVPLVILTAAALALLVQTAPGADPGPAPSDRPMRLGEVRPLRASDMASATREEVRAFVEEQFAGMDRDKSGFIERGEAPEQGVKFTDARWEGEGLPPPEWFEQQEFRPLPVEPDMARAAFLAQYDSNADGKVNLDEYRARVEPNTMRSGLPKRWLEERRARS